MTILLTFGDCQGEQWGVLAAWIYRALSARNEQILRVAGAVGLESYSAAAHKLTGERNQ
jgi:hypothetical protein